MTIASQKAFPTWADSARALVDTAAGRVPAEVIIKSGTWVNVHTREVLPGHDIAITKVESHASYRMRPIAPGQKHRLSTPQAAI